LALTIVGFRCGLADCARTEKAERKALGPNRQSSIANLNRQSAINKSAINNPQSV
jgi:hypothetical protein